MTNTRLDLRIEEHRFTDDGHVPNNAALPVIVYRAALETGPGAAAACERLFARNDWGASWVNGIYAHHHYHSTAREVLGITARSVRVRLGGENGNLVELGAGDVVVIPAGVAHKNEGASPDLTVVGAYPGGQGPSSRGGALPIKAEAPEPLQAAPRVDDIVCVAGGRFRRLDELPGFDHVAGAAHSVSVEFLGEPAAPDLLGFAVVVCCHDCIGLRRKDKRPLGTGNELLDADRVVVYDAAGEREEAQKRERPHIPGPFDHGSLASFSR